VSLVPWRALDRVEPYERLLPAVALSTTGGKRVPPLTLLLRTPRAESLKSMPNAVRRPPRQGREPRAALRAPSIVECIVLGLRRIRPRGRSRGFAASILPPTLFRRRPPKRQVARRPLPWAHHPWALAPHVARRLLQSMRSTSTFRAIGGLPCFHRRETEVPRGEEQVRAPCGAPQPSDPGRGSVCAGTNPESTLLPPRLLAGGRATPARVGSNTSVERPWPVATWSRRGSIEPPPPHACARGARLPGRGASRRPPRREPTIGRTEVLSVAGPPRERMGRPVRPSIAGEAGYRPSACSISA
jgi:hypothetical protein